MMDILTIERYFRKDSVVDEKVKSLKNLTKSGKLPQRNTRLTKNDLVRSDVAFLDFYINGISLTEILDKYNNNNGSVLDNWIGVLGITGNHFAEIIKVKQLLGKNVSDKEIRRIYPSDWTDDEFSHNLQKYRDELADPEILIYCCAECGDYDCGGIGITIERNDHSIIWRTCDDKTPLKFEFDRNLYYTTLNKRLNYLEKLGLQ